jgi:hypothetical protein
MKRIALLFFVFLSISTVAMGQRYVVITWTASASVQGGSCGSVACGPIGYNIYRGTTSGGESPTPLNPSPTATNCSGAACTYTDSTVTVGHTYYYYIQAYDETWLDASVNSNEASATVNPIVPSTQLVAMPH